MTTATRSSRNAKTKSAPPKHAKKTGRGSHRTKPKRIVSAVTSPAEAVDTSIAATAPSVTGEQIAQRAYEIWLEKGRPFGQEAENWAQATAELLG